MNRAVVHLAALLAAGSAVAAETGGTLEFSRVPLSVRQQGAAGLYGSCDVFKAFSNPGLLGRQPRAFEAGAANQLQFGGDQNLWAVAGAWAAQPKEQGSWAAAVMASGFSLSPIEDFDIVGQPTGQKITLGGLQGGLAVAYQWNQIGVGASARYAGESYGTTVKVDNLGNRSAVTVDGGAVVTLGRIEAGVSFRRVGVTSAVGAGAAYKLNGPFEGAIGGDWTAPLGGSVKGYGGGGVTWKAHRMLEVRAGYGVRRTEGVLSAGFTVPWRTWTFDYAFQAAVPGAFGASHLVGLGCSFGPERVEPVRAAFTMEAKEKTLAVAAFEPQNVSAGDASVISDLIRNELVREGTFNVIEKANMDKVLAEQAFQQTGCTTSECAVKLGKLLNVRFLVVGSFGKIMDSFLVGMRVVDIETGRIVYSDAAQGKSLSEIQEGIRGLARRLAGAVNRVR
ncbi:MAG: CsgG/HfaB family protein [Candidatus Coatesbacteria bacterium]